MVDAMKRLDPAVGDSLGFSLAYNRDTVLRMKNITAALCWKRGDGSRWHAGAAER